MKKNWNKKERMSAGTAAFTALGPLMELWLRLAYRGSNSFPVPQMRTAQAVLIWAEKISAAADLVLGREYAPWAWADPGVVNPETRVSMGWRGQWTQGRYVRIELFFNEGGFDFGRLEWDSGTGRSSGFLGIEGAIPESCGRPLRGGRISG